MYRWVLRLVVIQALILSTQIYAEYSTLEQARSKISFPHYNLETKKIVLNQSKLILKDIFVHSDLKIKDFGYQADPLPKLEALEKRLASITDADFHQSLTDIFLGLKDLHTLYYLPKPFSCYENFLPFRFKHVEVGKKQKAFAVTNVDTRREILNLTSEPSKIALGDFLISYNGIPTEEAVSRAMNQTYGPNQAAQFRLAQDDLRYYNHLLDHLPKTNIVNLEFENSKGEKYKLKLPWITYADDNCLESSNSMPLTETKNLKKMGRLSGHTDEPILYWSTNHPGFGDFGYIELTSFNPEVLSNDETFMKIRDLLLHELKDTDGLVIDLRDNGGGQIPLAEKIIQLFTYKEVNPMQYILKNSETNYIYFSKTDPEDPFTRLLEIAQKLGTPYTSSYSISEKEEINDFGQAYFKPIAVFVNSKCFSSCEVFAAQIQDHEAGTVFGEDIQTGGGGANYYSLNQILEEKFAQTNPIPFENIPAGQNIIFSLRQAVRVGKNSGILIENLGVKADRLSQMHRSDIFNATNDQLLVLQKYLASVTDQYTSSIYLDKDSRYDFVLNQEPLIGATWADTTTFEFKRNGKTLEKRAVKQNSSSSFSLPISVNKISYERLEIFGFHHEKPAWRKVINYRVVPKFKPAVIRKNLISRMAIYNVNSSKENGWRKLDNTLMVGNGTKYKNLVETEASLFVSLPKIQTQLHFTAIVNTESNFDFLKIYAIHTNEKKVLLHSLSGHHSENNYSIDLSAFAGKNIELRFVFESDEGTRDEGVILKNVRIE